MNTLYMIFIFIIVYTLMCGITDLLAGIAPSFLVFHSKIKNNIKFKQSENIIETKKISLILNVESNISKFIAKINDLTNLQYKNYDIFIVNSSKNQNVSRKIIEQFNLNKINKSINYILNKKEIISIYSNGIINLINKEEDNKWGNINAVIDNSNCDLFIAIDKDIIPEKSSLKNLVRAFNIDDNLLFSSGIIKDSSYIINENMEYKGVKTHKFLSCFSILKNIKNNLFQKAYNSEFGYSEEIDKTFTLYNKSKVMEVKGFESNTLNPYNSLKKKLINKFSNNHTVDYDALAFEEIEDIHNYINKDTYNHFINVIKEKKDNSFMKILKLYNVFDIVINPIIEIPMIFTTVIFTIIGVISPIMLLYFFIIYISFDIIKNTLLHITDKILLSKNINITESIEFIGFLILYNIGFRQAYNLSKLFILFKGKEKREHFYQENELFGYKSELVFTENEKYENIISNKDFYIDNKKDTLEENTNTTKDNKSYLTGNIDKDKEAEIENIIHEANNIKKENILSENENIHSEEEIDKFLYKEIEKFKEEIELKEEQDELLENINDIENITEEEEPHKEHKESELDKIMKEVMKTSDKIEILSAQVNKELHDIEIRTKSKDTKKELEEFKNQVLNSSDNPDNSKNKNHEQDNNPAKEEIAATNIKEDLSLDENKIEEEFKNITI